jgi:hypothetical protein
MVSGEGYAVCGGKRRAQGTGHRAQSTGRRAQGAERRAQGTGQKKSDGMIPSPGTGVMLAI